MRSVIVTGMMVVVLVYTRRHLRIAHDECETSVYRRRHESRRNECPQEQYPEDEQRRPSWLLNVPHSFHRCADSGTISSKRSRHWRHFGILWQIAHTHLRSRAANNTCQSNHLEKLSPIHGRAPLWRSFVEFVIRDGLERPYRARRYLIASMPHRRNRA
jgi:hypothetical protein